MSDPYPYRVHVIDQANTDHVVAREGERLSDPSWTTFWDAKTETLIFDPRPAPDPWCAECGTHDGPFSFEDETEICLTCKAALEASD